MKSKDELDRLYNAAAILSGALIAKMGDVTPKDAASEFNKVLRSLVQAQPQEAYAAGLATLQSRKANANTNATPAPGPTPAS